jgi:secreted trypsin-like serine protease
MRSFVPPRTLLICVLALAALAASGAPASAQTVTPRIIGGDDVPISKYPFQARLRIRDGLSTYLCGASIIDSTHVVTAAHCVTNETTRVSVQASGITVYYGSASTSTQKSVGASAVDVPPEYTRPLNRDDSYDVAQITLSSTLAFDSTTQPIRFANPNQPKDVGNGFVTGFGLTSNGCCTSNTLKGVTVPLQVDSKCTAVYGSYYVADRSVCAGGGSAAQNNPDTCNGDSGGPLIVDIDNRTSVTDYVLLGLTSYGTQECGQQYAPAVYTYLQGAGIRSFLTAGTDSSTYTSGNFETIPRQTTPAPAGPSPAPATTAPITPAPAADRTKPTARVTKVRCKHRRCTIRLRATDTGGGKVKKLSVRVRGKVRKCRAEGFGVSCRTVRSRTKMPRAKKVAGGYRVTVKLRPGRYSVTAVATDTSGNRSKTARKGFRVRR